MLFQNSPRRSCYITGIVFLCPGPLPRISPAHVCLLNLQRAKLQVFCPVSLTSGHEDNDESSPMLAFTPFSCIMALLLLFEISWFLKFFFFLSCTLMCMQPLYTMCFSIFWLISLFSSYLEPDHCNFVMIFTLCLWNQWSCSAIRIQGLYLPLTTDNTANSWNC